jgi:hypothetical protein
MKRTRKIAIGYLTLQTIVWVVFLFGPLISFDVVLQTHNTTNISSETVVYDGKLPIPFWTPMDVTRSPQFEIAYTYIVLMGSINTLNLVGIEIFCMTIFIYLTGQFELLRDSIRNASEKVIHRLDTRQRSSADSNGINKRLEFRSDKKTKFQHSRAVSESVNSTKGNANIIYTTHQYSLKHAPEHAFSSGFLPIFLLANLQTKLRSEVSIFFLHVFDHFRSVGIPAECLP